MTRTINTSKAAREELAERGPGSTYHTHGKRKSFVMGRANKKKGARRTVSMIMHRAKHLLDPLAVDVKPRYANYRPGERVHLIR